MTSYRLLASKLPRSIRGAAALALCCLLLTTGCKTNEDAIAAATQMSATAKALADYYGALDRILKETDGLNALQAAMLSIPYGDADRKQIAAAAAEIGKREAMAATLSTLADSFSSLASPDAAKSAGESVEKLQTQLESIKQVAAASPEIDVVVGAMKLVIQAVQAHKERDAARAMSTAIVGLHGLFAKETRYYGSLDAQYLEVAKSLAGNLVDQGQVDESSFLNSALEPFDLKPSVTSTELKTRVDSIAKRHIQSVAEAQKIAFTNSSDAMEQALAEMSRRVDLVANDKPMTFRLPPASLTTVKQWAGQQVTGLQVTGALLAH